MTNPWDNFWPTFISSALVAIVSVVTLVLANRHQGKLKELDRRREELGLIGSAIKETRAAVTNARGMLDALDESNPMAQLLGTGATKAALKAIDDMKAARSNAEPLLVSLAFTSPHEDIRIVAGLIDSSLADAIDNMIPTAVAAKLKKEAVDNAETTLTKTQKMAEELLNTSHEIYYSTYPTEDSGFVAKLKIWLSRKLLRWSKRLAMTSPSQGVKSETDK